MRNLSQSHLVTGRTSAGLFMGAENRLGTINMPDIEKGKVIIAML